jgi:hypothetical protein
LPAPYPDLAAWLLEHLRATSTVTDLVQGGADGILESGELDGDALEALQRARLESGDFSRVLSVVVTDEGEGQGGQRSVARQQEAAVFIYDRGGGYGKIRLVREAILTAVINQPVQLVRGALIVGVKVGERTGHLRFNEFDLDYEAVSFSGPITVHEDVYA